jgi:hypothetical protein
VPKYLGPQPRSLRKALEQVLEQILEQILETAYLAALSAVLLSAAWLVLLSSSDLCWFALEGEG